MGVEMEKQIKELVNKELIRSTHIHEGTFPSVEHALTVIREEVEEVEESTQELRRDFNIFWTSYRENQLLEEELDSMELTCEHLIKEAVQVMAMIEKYRQSGFVYKSPYNFEEVK